MKLSYRSFTPVVLMALGAPLALPVTTANAVYLIDGAKQTSTTPAVYDIPKDGMCVVGIKANGDLLVDKSIKNARECDSYTTNLTGMTTQVTCAPNVGAGGVGTDGYRHKWGTSNVCVNDAAPTMGIPLTDLDRTDAMCQAKGGTDTTSPGTCVAFGWLYRGLKDDGDGTASVIPITGSAAAAPYNNANYVVFKGVTVADGAHPENEGLGFCYASMDFTADGPGSPYVAGTCPTTTNFPTVPPSANNWTWTGTQCRNSYGVKGRLAAAIAATGNAAGNIKNAGDPVDLTLITDQGTCLANGYSWENWTPTTGLVQIGASGNYIAGMDFTSGGKDGGARFVTRQCLRCHSDQSRRYSERTKSGFVKTGHKLAGDSTDPVWAAIGDDWGLKGIQCSMCHAATNPSGQNDIIQVDAAGAPVLTSGHDQDAYGAQINQLCYFCHSDAAKGVSANTTPATVIPVEGGEFKQNDQNLAPIVNQFLNSPHAGYFGDNTGAQLQDKTNYASAFVGYLCRSSADAVGDAAGSILTTFWDGDSQTIPALDTLANPDCTNLGTADPSGAAGFWVKEGSDAGNRQGNCSTCHDVHWSLDDNSLKRYTSAKLVQAEPIRRECTTCHENGASATGAPQNNLSDIKHPAVAGSPAYGGGNTVLTGTDVNYACEICHMPKLTAGGSRMHLWRINVDPAYRTAGATQANLVANEAFVDLRSSCGSCHGAGGTAHRFTQTQIAGFADSMHDGGAAFSVACATCHGAKTVAHPTGARTPNDCLDCHRTTRPGVEPSVAKACITCHARNRAAKHQFTAAQLSSFADVIHDGGPAPTKTCVVCHANRPANRINHPVTLSCRTCHVRQGIAPTVAMACNPCHGGSSGRSNVAPGAPYITATKLATAAANIHIH